MTEMLLAAGASTEVADEDGRRPLHEAVAFGLKLSSSSGSASAAAAAAIAAQKHIIALLVRQGKADVDAPDDSYSRKTALTLAIERKDEGMCRLLLSLGAKKQRDDGGKEYAELAREIGMSSCVGMFA